MLFQYCIQNHNYHDSFNIYILSTDIQKEPKLPKKTLSQVGVCLCMYSCGIWRKPMLPKVFLPPNCLMQPLKRLAVFPLKCLNIFINYCEFVPSDTHLIYITLLFYSKPYLYSLKHHLRLRTDVRKTPIHSGPFVPNCLIQPPLFLYRNPNEVPIYPRDICLGARWFRKRGIAVPILFICRYNMVGLQDSCMESHSHFMDSSS